MRRPGVIKGLADRLWDAAFHTQEDACYKSCFWLRVELVDRHHRTLAQGLDDAPLRTTLVARKYP